MKFDDDMLPYVITEKVIRYLAKIDDSVERQRKATDILGSLGANEIIRNKIELERRRGGGEIENS